jgi:hypothetical protein
MMQGEAGPPFLNPPSFRTLGAPPHPTKSAPHHRDFVGTPGAAHRFAAARHVRGDGKTVSQARAEPLLTATHDLRQDLRGAA